MTGTTTQTIRDDLFTHIHKGLRLALFEISVEAARLDWNERAQVAALGARWHDVLDLLRAHTDHEDHYIFRLLDSYDPAALEAAADQHRDLEDLLEDLADRFEAILANPDRVAGLELYRDLNRFVASYLPHLHDEETRIMGRIWEFRSDEEIADCRSRFMAATPPQVRATSLRYMLPAIDHPTRLALAAGIVGSPEPVIAGVVAIAEQVLDAQDAAQVRAVLLPAD
jgi:hemerythrin-like domain-containing protein